jgi:hypothetical protein
MTVVAKSAADSRFARAWAQVARLRRSGWTVRVWDADAERGRLLVDGLEPGGTFEQGYGFRGSIDRHGNLTAEPAVAGDD